MHRRLRPSIAAYLVVMVIALLGCGDGSAQAPELDIEVRPDTARFDLEAQSVRIRYAIRNTAGVELLASSPDLQQEGTPGSWTTWVDPNSRYIQDVLGPTMSVALAPGYAADFVTYRQLGAGRYRLRVLYQRSGQTGVNNPGMSIEALSNVFVVLR